MFRRGQTEFVAITGIIIVVIVVVYFAAQTFFWSPVPSGVKEEQNLVKESIEGITRNAAINTIKTLEANSGYLTQDEMINGFTVFGMKPVAYWQKCQYDVSPKLLEIEERIKTGIKLYLKNTLQKEMHVFGKNVTFDLDNFNENNIKVRIFDEKVEITVNLLTKVQDYVIREPYTVRIETKFGRIYNFASGLADELAKNRYFETFTENEIRINNKLPTFGVMWECGQSIFLTADEIATAMEGIIRYIYVNTLFWKNVVNNGGIFTYGIPDLNGKKYEDLDIEFKLRDSFGIEVIEPMILINSEPIIKSNKLPMIPMCINLYEQNYSMNYPLIIKVRDTYLRNNFYFAIFVYLDNMNKGSCDNINDPSECDDLNCKAKIKIIDSSNNPLEGARAFFGDCYIGTSNPDGFIEGNIFCSPKDLSIYYKQDYEFYLEEKTPLSIRPDKNAVIKLRRKPNITFNFVHGSSCANAIGTKDELVIVNITPKTVDSKLYVITNNDPDFDLDTCDTGELCDKCKETDDEDICLECNLIRTRCMKQNGLIEKTNVYYIPAGEYEMSLMILDPGRIETYVNDKWKSYNLLPIETIKIDFTIPEEDININIYTPDPDIIYAEAKSKYDDKYGEQTGLDCLFRVCLCDDDCAKGLALTEAMKYIQKSHGFSMEVCS